MTENEKEFAVRVNVDKAKNKSKVSLLFIIISILTYVEPLVIYNEFDFGIIFEITSLIFLIVGRKYMEKYDEISSKRCINCAILLIVILWIFDVIRLISSIKKIEDIVFLGYSYFFGEWLLILYVMTLFVVNRKLAKADNPIKYKESTDWFYEQYEDKNNK